MELVMKEALSIRMTSEDAHFNRDDGYELPECWITTYKILRAGPARVAPTTRAALDQAAQNKNHATLNRSGA